VAFLRTVQGVVTQMSDVRFFVDRSEDSDRRVLPVVDGQSLVDLARTYEAGHGFDVPGGYEGLSIDNFGFGDLELYLTGSSDVWPGQGRVALLGCDCGEVGCWPLFARVRRTTETVMWESFENPHRLQRDYGGLGPFTFSAAAYEAALRALRTDLAA
jgi:hypothetical protein